MAELLRRFRKHARLLAGVAVAAVVLVIAAGIVVPRILSSPRVTAWVRSKVIAQIEQVTGGRVELGSVHWKPLKFEFDLRDITIHGLEAPNDMPYVHADRLLVHARIISLLGRRLGLSYVGLERPAVHLIVNADGTTNVPAPRAKKASSKSAIDKLFDIAVTRAEIRNGVLRLNERVFPLDVSAADVALGLKYVRQAHRYDGSLWVGNLETRYSRFQPPATSIDASFSLWRNHAVLNSLNLASGKSRVQLRGQMDGYLHPRISLSSTAEVDLAQLARSAGVREIRGGRLTLNGQGEWTEAGFTSNGRIAILDLDYYGDGLKLVRANVGTDYSATNQKLALPHIFAALSGGTVVGDATVTNWLARTGSVGAARLRLNNLLASRLAEVVSTPSFPLERVRFAGTGSGSLDVNWKDSLSRANVGVVFDMTPASSAGAGNLPLSATLRGVYRGDARVLDIEDLRASTPATTLNAVGVLGAASALNVSANTTNMGELQPLIQAFGGPQKLPLDIRGRAAFNGRVNGRLAAPAIAGRLEIAAFESLIAPARANGAQASRMHWDHLAMDLEYSPVRFAARNARLRKGQAQVELDIVAQLRKGRFTESSPFEAQVSVRNGSVSDLLALGGYSYPITGTADLKFHVSGTQAAPQGSGSVVVTKAEVYGEPVQRASSAIRFANHEAQLTGIEIVQNGASVTGNAGYNLTTTAFHFNLQGSRFNLARYRQLQSTRFSVAGRLDFTASGSGTKDAPAVNGNLQVRDVLVNGERLGNLSATATTAGDTLRLVSHLNAPKSTLDVDGTARLRGDFPASFNIRFSRLDIDPVINAFLKARLTAHSMAMGSVSIQGPLRDPRALKVAASIDELFAEAEHIQVRNSGPVRLSYGQQILRVDQLRLLGNDTDLAASGSVQFSGAKQISLSANGHVNLKLLQSIQPGLISYGTATANMRVRGDLSRPLFSGRLDIANGALSYVDLPNGLSDINGRLTFNQDRLQVTSLTARTGGGLLNISGHVSFGQGASLNLNASGRDIRLRYPAGVSSMANAELRLSGSPRNATLSGDVTITRFGINPQFDFSTYLMQAKQTPVTVNTSSPLSRLRLDVHVVSTPELQVQTSLAKVSGNVDLRLRGTPLTPVVLGRVNIVEGEMSFNGTKYRLERGDITFNNPARIEPVVDIQATTTVRSYDVTLGFHGPTSKLSTTYRSDPPLATADIVSLLAFGRTREESAQQQASQNQNLPESASYAILNQALNAAVSSRMQKIFGVSRIKIDPQAGGVANNTAGPTVTIEQQMTNNLTITYISNISRANYQTIQAEYNVNRNVSIVAVRDWNGVVSFDVRIRQRKK